MSDQPAIVRPDLKRIGQKLAEAADTLERRGHDPHMRRGAYETVRQLANALQRFADPSLAVESRRTEEDLGLPVVHVPRSENQPPEPDPPATVSATVTAEHPGCVVLPYERVDDGLLLKAIRLYHGERLLVLQPFGWHLDGRHIPNAAEHFSRDSVCDEHGWFVVCEFGPYVAVVVKRGDRT